MPRPHPLQLTRPGAFCVWGRGLRAAPKKYRKAKSPFQGERTRRGTDGVRTRDLRFTRPTPYHLATAPDGLAAAARRQWKAAAAAPPGPGVPPATEHWGGTGGAVPLEPGPGTGTGRTGGTRPALPRVPGSPAWSSLPPFSRFAPVSLSSAYAGEAA